MKWKTFMGRKWGQGKHSVSGKVSSSQVLIRKIQTGCFKVTFLEEVETAILQISLIYLGEKDSI